MSLTKLEQLQHDVRDIALDMHRAYDLEARDPDKQVTRFDARRWGEELTLAVAASTGNDRGAQ